MKNLLDLYDSGNVYSKGVFKLELTESYTTKSISSLLSIDFSSITTTPTRI